MNKFKTKEEALANALWDVKISFDDVKVEVTGVSQATAIDIVERLIEAHPLNDELRRAYNGGTSFGYTGFGSAKLDFNVNAHFKREKFTETSHNCEFRLQLPSISHLRGDIAQNNDGWDTINGERACSFCGSGHPEDVIQLYREGANLSNGKPGKIYVQRSSVINAGFGIIKTYTHHFSKEQIDELNTVTQERKQ